VEILTAVKNVLDCSDPIRKAEQVRDLFALWKNDPVLPTEYPCSNDIPGRPDKPELVPPNEVPRRRLGSEQGKAALMHAVAHIEFNAINLALDMICRFSEDKLLEEPIILTDFLSDWLSVAADEARHFQMIYHFLQERGFTYGSFPAHDGLWDAARATSHDLAARLAIAPMVLEARGLDVTPQIIEKLRKNNESEAIEILKVILEEEVQHVFFGTKWFNFVAKARFKEPISYFQDLVRSHFKGKLKKPFNKSARLEAHLYEDFYLPLS